MGWDYPGLSRPRARIAPIVANPPRTRGRARLPGGFLARRWRFCSGFFCWFDRQWRSRSCSRGLGCITQHRLQRTHLEYRAFLAPNSNSDRTNSHKIFPRRERVNREGQYRPQVRQRCTFSESEASNLNVSRPINLAAAVPLGFCPTCDSSVCRVWRDEVLHGELF
jgi:hypothetical protein